MGIDTNAVITKNVYQNSHANVFIQLLKMSCGQEVLLKNNNTGNDCFSLISSLTGKVFKKNFTHFVSVQHSKSTRVH